MPSTLSIPSPRFMDLVPREFAREHLVLGCVAVEKASATERGGDRASNGATDLATTETAGGCDPIALLHAPACDPLVLHNLSVRLGVQIAPRVEDAESIARQIDEAYAAHAMETDAAHSSQTAAARRADREGVPTIALLGGDATEALGDAESELQRLAGGEGASDRDLLNLGDKAPVVRLVDAVLFEAIGRGASDIHIQPLADATLIRYRVDGVLLTARRVSPRLAPAIVSRIKVMARLDVAERRAAQDGRATVTIGRTGAKNTRHLGHGHTNGDASRAIDLRIATLPSAYGERVVIRLLDTQRGQALASLDALGMPTDVSGAYRDRAGRSSGIVLVTGPTGSGKTTTLYATLRWIARGGASTRSHSDGSPVNILTIEDPIEYDLTNMRVDDGATDNEHGPLDVPISQTQVDPKKNLTFATGLRHILRQDPDVIMVGEVRDADTAKIAIQASLTGHLVFSTLHTADAPGAVTRLIDLGVEPYLVASSLSCVLAQRLVRTLHSECGGRGCDACLRSGFKGRRGIFELLVVDGPIREMIGAGTSAAAIRDAAITRGMRRLEDQGAALATAGVTTVEEVRRVTLGADG